MSRPTIPRELAFDIQKAGQDDVLQANDEVLVYRPILRGGQYVTPDVVRVAATAFDAGGGDVTAEDITDSSAGGRELLTEMAALQASKILATDASSNPTQLTIGTGLQVTGSTLEVTGESVATVTASGITDATAGGREILTEMEALEADKLVGMNGSANPVNIDIGTGLTLSAGTLSRNTINASDIADSATGGRELLTEMAALEASKLIGTNASSNPVSITLGTGLEFDGTTLNATGEAVGTVTSAGITDASTGGREILTEMPSLVANRLVGTDGSANPVNVTIGSGLSLSSGTLAATTNGGVPAASPSKLWGTDTLSAPVNIDPGAGLRIISNGLRTRDYDARIYDVQDLNDITLSDSESVEGSDTAAAINQAITDCSAAGGGTVYLKTGVWWISSSIQMRSNVRLSGAGWETVIKLKANSNVHMITLQSGTAEFFSIDNMRIEGNRDAQGIPQGTENIWVNCIHFAWSTSGFTRTDPQCFFWNLFIFNACCDGINVTGRGGHVWSNIHVGETRRYGAFLSTWDSIYFGIYCGGPGADGIRVDAGPAIIIGSKVFFTGKRTDALSDTSLRQSHASSPIQITNGEDWRYGCGIRSAGGNITVGCEMQDTCGHGFVIFGPGDVHEGARFGNVGSLSEHFIGSFGNARAISDIACVYFSGSDVQGNRISGAVVDQFMQNNGNEPATCHYLVNIDTVHARGNVVDIAYRTDFIRQANNVKSTTVDVLHNNDIRYKREKMRSVFANFTLARSDHQNFIVLRQAALTTISGTAGTLGNGFRVGLWNRTGATVTGPGSTSIAHNTLGVLSTDGSTFTWTVNAVIGDGSREIELRDNYTVNALDRDFTLLCKSAITLTIVAANLGNGFRCKIINDSGGSVTAGNVTISNQEVAELIVTNGAAKIAKYAMAAV